MPVTVIFDGTAFPAPIPVITDAQVGMEVKYVPTPGAADDQ
jgi:hypothetical protein